MRRNAPRNCGAGGDPQSGHHAGEMVAARMDVTYGTGIVAISGILIPGRRIMRKACVLRGMITRA